MAGFLGGAELALYPGGVHGFNSPEGQLGEAANARFAHYPRVMRDPADGA